MMGGKLLLIIGLFPFVVSFIVAQFFGVRRFSLLADSKKTALEVAELILEMEGVTVVLRRSWWFGANPLKGKEFSLSKEHASSQDIRKVATVAHTAGMAVLQLAHEKSVLMRYKSIRFASVMPLFAIIAAILARVVGKVGTSMCLGLVSLSLGLACVASLINLATEREAARRAIHILESKGFFKKLSEQEMFEEALYGIAYVNALPKIFHKFVFARKQ